MRTLLLAVSACLLFGCAAATTQQPVDPLSLPVIGGTLSRDLLLDGDYLLKADLQVPPGVTLKIMPGTTIYLQPSDSTKIDPEFLSREVELLVRGGLHAVGTSQQPIRFTPVSDDPEAILWSGIELVATDKVVLAHVIVEQAEAGVLCLNSSPQIEALQVRRSRYGMLLQQNSAPRVLASKFSDGEAGLFCWDQSAPQVIGSSISRQQEEGLYLGSQCRGEFINNRISGNDRGVVLPAAVEFDVSNQVQGNRVDLLRYAGGSL